MISISVTRRGMFCTGTIKSLNLSAEQPEIGFVEKRGGLQHMVAVVTAQTAELKPQLRSGVSF
jgi:hypothetical protein